MKCDKAKSLIIEALVKEIDPTKQTELQQHLDACEACRSEYQALKETIQVMHRWEDVVPAKQMVFVDTKPSLLETTKSWLTLPATLPKRWAWVTGGLAVAGLLLFVFLYGSEFSYHQGQLTVSFGKVETATQEPPASPELVNLLQGIQEQNLLVMEQMVQASESRQQENLDVTLAKLSQQLQLQRLADLQLVGESLGKMQQHSEYNFDRTNVLLEGLIQYTTANYSP